MTLPAPSARICTSMCRGSITACSRKTVGTPKADSPSRTAAWRPPRSSVGPPPRRARGGGAGRPRGPPPPPPPPPPPAGDGLDEERERDPLRRGQHRLDVV